MVIVVYRGASRPSTNMHTMHRAHGKVETNIRCKEAQTSQTGNSYTGARLGSYNFSTIRTVESISYQLSAAFSCSFSVVTQSHPKSLPLYLPPAISSRHQDFQLGVSVKWVMP